MILAAVVVGGLLLLGVGAVLLDRTTAAIGERKASEYLAAPFGSAAIVRVHGVPFLTQAIRGRYRDVEVSGGGLRLGEIAGASLVAHLTNVYLPLRQLLGGRTTELPCERVDGRVVLPYGELARVARIPGLVLRFDDGRLLATAALPVPGFSQLARVKGEAVLSQVGAGSVWLRINGVSVVGISVPSVVLTQLLPSLNVPVPLPTLPFGLRIDELAPTPAGLLVCGSAGAVVFRSPAAAVPLPPVG